MFISVVSLIVSIEHGRTMEKMVQQNEKMVAASTVPYLTLSSAQLDPVTNKPLARLILKNGGVGPALVNWFDVRYKGVSYAGPATLMKACCAEALPKDAGKLNGVVYSYVSHNILPARESVDVLTVRPDMGERLLKAFDDATRDLAVTACYCSVLGECWQTDFGARSPQAVKECKVPAGSKTW